MVYALGLLGPLGSLVLLGPSFPVCRYVHFLKGFYFDACKLLNANAFVYMYNKLEPNVHYNANTLEIVSKPYLDYYSGEYSN